MTNVVTQAAELSKLADVGLVMQAYLGSVSFFFIFDLAASRFFLGSCIAKKSSEGLMFGRSKSRALVMSIFISLR